jgi:hypothetical protein
VCAAGELFRSATRGRPIREVADPWDAPDALEWFEDRPDFTGRWRGFLRDCALLILPVLPPEAAQWAWQCIAVADEFDSGRLGTDGLTSARVWAWQFHDARRDTSPAVELSGLRAVMYRLWPPDAGSWHECAWHFLRFLDGAGVSPERWWPLLLNRFDGLLVGPA